MPTCSNPDNPRPCTHRNSWRILERRYDRIAPLFRRVPTDKSTLVCLACHEWWRVPDKVARCVSDFAAPGTTRPIVNPVPQQARSTTRAWLLAEPNEREGRARSGTREEQRQPA